MGKFITISELSKELGLVKSNKYGLSYHTLRYWEKEFKQIKPKKINKRRYYSSDQVAIIKFIKILLKDKGMTIKGVKKVLNYDKKLDYNELYGLSEENYRKNIKYKIKVIFDRIKKLKKLHGKKNTH